MSTTAAATASITLRPTTTRTHAHPVPPSSRRFQVRVILNKADSLEPAELLKINSALTWNLARILKVKESPRGTGCES